MGGVVDDKKVRFEAIWDGRDGRELVYRGQSPTRKTQCFEKLENASPSILSSIECELRGINDGEETSKGCIHDVVCKGVQEDQGAHIGRRLHSQRT